MEIQANTTCPLSHSLRSNYARWILPYEIYLNKYSKDKKEPPAPSLPSSLISSSSSASSSSCSPRNKITAAEIQAVFASSDDDGVLSSSEEELLMKRSHMDEEEKVEPADHSTREESHTKRPHPYHDHDHPHHEEPCTKRPCVEEEGNGRRSTRTRVPNSRYFDDDDEEQPRYQTTTERTTTAVTTAMATNADSEDSTSFGSGSEDDFSEDDDDTEPDDDNREYKLAPSRSSASSRHLSVDDRSDSNTQQTSDSTSIRRSGRARAPNPRYNAPPNKEPKKRKSRRFQTAATTSIHQPTIVYEKPETYLPGELCELCYSTEHEDRILLCDGCNLGFHTYCLTPAIQNIPAGEWFCAACLVANTEDDFGFGEGKEYSLHEFQKVADNFKLQHFARRKGLRPESLTGAKKQKFLDSLTHDELEQEFWRLSMSPFESVEVEYGADLHSSIKGR